MTLTVTPDHQAMTTRVRSSGSDNVTGAGTWAYTVVASGPDGSTTATASRSGSGALAIPDVNHVAFRRPGAGVIGVEGRLTRDGVIQSVERTTVPVAARPARSGLVGAVVYPILPVAPYTTTANALAVIDKMPSGMGCVRVSLPWVSIQPSAAGTFDPTLVAHLDTFFAGCASRNLKVLLSVGTSPTWARVGGTNQAPPTSAATFGQWVDDILDRWDGTADIVSIDPWNEPKGLFTGTDAQMVGLVRAAHTAAAGRALVSTPSLALADAAYLERLFAAGLTSADFDAVDFHPYGLAFTGNNMRPIDPRFPPPAADRAGSPLAGLHDLIDVLALHGATGKTFIASETGAAPFPRGTSSVNDPSYQLDADTARVWLDTQLDQLRRAGVAYSVCYVSQDPVAASGGWADNYGLLDSAGNRRATWQALAAHL